MESARYRGRPGGIAGRLVAIGLVGGFALLLGQGCARGDPPAQGDAREAEVIALGGGPGGAAHACVACHGPAGEGDGVSPWLAGLPAGYIEKQLLDYAQSRRPDAIMTPIAKALEARERRGLARYYAAMPVPTRGSGAPGPVAGEHLYRRSVDGGPSCAACHGPDGRGLGPANPPLAGQPPTYTASQLHRWKDGVRRNDGGAVMHRAVSALDDGEIGLLADWLAGLSPAPAPAGPVSSASAPGP
ncbi:MAG: c-type cytochrome [Caulobacter sp.]